MAKGPCLLAINPLHDMMKSCSYISYAARIFKFCETSSGVQLTKKS